MNIKKFEEQMEKSHPAQQEGKKGKGKLILILIVVLILGYVYLRYFR